MGFKPVWRVQRTFADFRSLFRLSAHKPLKIELTLASAKFGTFLIELPNTCANVAAFFQRAALFAGGLLLDIFANAFYLYLASNLYFSFLYYFFPIVGLICVKKYYFSYFYERDVGIHVLKQYSDLIFGVT